MAAIDGTRRDEAECRPGVVLRGKAVVVTGASRGIGREIAFALAVEGCRLLLTYLHDEPGAEAVAARCRELGAEAVAIAQLEMRDDRSLRTLVDRALAEFGAIDILVNNAGVVVWKPFAEQTFAEIDEQITVNLTGTMKLTHLALPHVTEAIVNVASTASLHGTPTLSAYGASKWGLRGFTKVLAKEHPELRVFAVHPTVTATRMNDFEGMPPETVAAVVVRALRGEIDPGPEAEVDVREHAPPGPSASPRVVW
jgi:NAD(P)-dependent dehydrogenase (short-subunit alcohol dehydrogenase family)